MTHARRTALLALAALPLPLLGVTTAAPVHAVQGTAQMTFQDCEITWNDENSLPQEKYVGNLPLSITIDHPAPIRTEQGQTVEVTLSELPANTFPKDLTTAKVALRLGIDDGRWGFQYQAERTLVGGFDASSPVAFGEFEEDDVAYYEAGIHPWAVKDLQIQLSGDNEVDTGWFFILECDQLVNPQPIVNVAVYDLTAAATATVSKASAKQGTKVTVTGRHLLAGAPTGTEKAVVTVGGQQVAELPVDATGTAKGTVTVPPFLAPGKVQVRLTNGAKSASTALKVEAAAAKVVPGAKQVKAGARLKVSGTKFKPGEKVTVALTGGKGSGKKSFSKSVKANASGGFTVQVKLNGAAKGGWKVRATGASSKRVGKASFKVG